MHSPSLTIQDVLQKIYTKPFVEGFSLKASLIILECKKNISQKQLLLVKKQVKAIF